MDTSVPRGCIAGIIAPPCSKSYAQRALAAALLSEGVTTLRNVEFCKDTISAIHCIEALGASVEQLDSSTLLVRGGLNPQKDTLMVGESGLATRLFTPIASLHSEPITIFGEGTLLYRPMNMMIEPLRELGVEVRDNAGRVPIIVRGPMRGGEVNVDGSVSSQFVTGLLLALPMAEQETVIHVSHAVSKPYLDMTIETAARFGVEILHSDYREFFIAGGQRYKACDFSIEGDWSSAASLLVAGAVAGEVTLRNMTLLSKQADVAICDALVKAGASLISDSQSVTVQKRPLHAFEFDATDCPDLFPVLAALAAACEGVSVLRGTKRLEHKESNRAEAIAEEYGKLGINVDISEDDIMRIEGGEIEGGVEVDSWQDHRIAMSLAISGLRSQRGVLIRDAECVEKSYPEFFRDLESLRVEE